MLFAPLFASGVVEAASDYGLFDFTLGSREYFHIRLNLDEGNLVRFIIRSDKPVSIFLVASITYSDYRESGIFHLRYDDILIRKVELIDRTVSVSSTGDYYLLIFPGESDFWSIHVSAVLLIGAYATIFTEIPLILAVAIGISSFFLVLVLISPIPPKKKSKLRNLAEITDPKELVGEINTILKEARKHERSINPLIVLIFFILFIVFDGWFYMEMLSNRLLISDQFVLSLYLSPIVAGGMAAISYVIVSRQNEHLKRERALRKRLDRLVSILSESSPDGSKISPEKETISTAIKELNELDIKRSPVLLAALVFVVQFPVLGMFLLIAYGYGLILITVFVLLAIISLILFLHLAVKLTKTISNHHRLWKLFSDNVTQALWKSGYASGGEYKAVPDVRFRSGALYAILFIITNGYFLFYWWYALLKDWNNHLATHREFEKRFGAIVAAIKRSAQQQPESRPDYEI